MLLGQRYYDASVGRFISSDPIEDGDNWYAYCENNPLASIDPEGLQNKKPWVGPPLRGTVPGTGPGTGKPSKPMQHSVYLPSKGRAEDVARNGGRAKPAHDANNKWGDDPHFHSTDPIKGGKGTKRTGDGVHYVYPPKQRGAAIPKGPKGGTQASDGGGDPRIHYDPGIESGIQSPLYGVTEGAFPTNGFGGVDIFTSPLYCDGPPLNCFEEGTLVVMADGTLKRIEDIHSGDMVLSCDDKTGITMAKEVLYRSMNLNEETGVTLSLPAGETITATANHPFYVKGKGIVLARDLTSQMQLKLRTGDLVQARNISQQTATKRFVYNLTVSDFHTYFVGKAGVLVRGLSAAPKSRSNY